MADMVIRKFERGEDGYKRLALMAALLEYKSPNGWPYEVGETYFDFGQGWKWTTILCRGGVCGGFQAVNPAEQERILFDDVNTFPALADEILADKFCPDKRQEATA